MKRCIVCSFLLGVTMVLGSVRMNAADCDIMGPLRTQWDATKGLVMGIAEVIPEDKYDFKPTPEVMSFRQQLVHVVSENYYFMGTASGEKPEDRKQMLDSLKTRAEILKALADSYEHGAKTLADMTDAKAMEMTSFRGRETPRWSVVLANFADNMDHYGNLVVYVRLNGIVPPRTAARQQAPKK